jgi:hypothetical protein
MGFLILFYVEAKAFKLLVEKGLLVLRFMERSRELPHLVYIGKVIVAWLSSIVEA